MSMAGERVGDEGCDRMLSDSSSRDTGRVGLLRLCQGMNLDGSEKPGSSSVKRRSYHPVTR